MDFAPNMTCRYRLRYRSAGRTHNLGLRFGRGFSLASVGAFGTTLAGLLFTALAANMASDTAFLAAWTAQEDSDTFIPYGTLPAPITGGVSAGTYSKAMSIIQSTFSGLSDGGAKVRVVVYGFAAGLTAPGTIEEDFLITGPELAVVASAVSVLNADINQVAIDNTAPNFYNQMTIKPNDFYVRQLRRGH
jgi:hypothetical protein